MKSTIEYPDFDWPETTYRFQEWCLGEEIRQGFPIRTWAKYPSLQPTDRLIRELVHEVFHFPNKSDWGGDIG